MLKHGRELHDKYNGMLRHGRELLDSPSGMLRHGYEILDKYHGILKRGANYLTILGHGANYSISNVIRYDTGANYLTI